MGYKLTNPAASLGIRRSTKEKFDKFYNQSDFRSVDACLAYLLERCSEGTRDPREGK